MAPPSQNASGSASSSKRMSYMHLAWSLGHILVLLSTIWTFLGALFFKSRSTSYYIACSGAILSWSIVVYKSLGIPSFSRAYFQRAAMDENVQYLAVALYWFFSKPIYVTLLPFAIFSTFHSLTFVRTSLLPKIPSPKKDATGASTSSGTGSEGPQQVAIAVSRSIQNWVKQNYESAMYLVAIIEVVVIQGRVTVGALLFQNSFLHPLFFAHFLRLRFYLSPQTRAALSAVNTTIDHYLNHPSCPGAAKTGVNVVRNLIIQYADSVISVPAQPAGSNATPSKLGRPPATPSSAR
ncbi:uncharacterized protein MELLADRAFT_95878 [Melampsora larici-populina 98AG31]|uniref:Endoplasmic reticulum protein n=1 Tax=Melampsora larici-populina (strain 98AG31 / pathotype 3-4-7) TaxID=747676 RepID=F4RDK9_MELLP|nr:uncharacterized protein MELLADRAFT_95878 [Melampsora larici-populina 98AG31]EGG09591.1 hypothetical protein MELLADRAFT_95878 [Melampsora larici-populina 98AG31]